EFRVNSTTTGDQTSPCVAMDSLGDYVVVWASNGQDGSGWGVYGKHYNLLGLGQGDEFQVNSTTAGDQTSPSVARDGVGDFLVAWSSNGQDGSGQGIYAQQYSQIGQALENEFHVSSTTALDQSNPTVAMDSKGHLMIAWSGNGIGDADGVFFQRYAVNT